MNAQADQLELDLGKVEVDAGRMLEYMDGIIVAMDGWVKKHSPLSEDAARKYAGIRREMKYARSAVRVFQAYVVLRRV